MKNILKKSNDDSFFLNFHYNSERADDLFNDKPTYKNQRIKILQLSVVDEKFIIAEVMFSWLDQLV
jgi:hypothetical protein